MVMAAGTESLDVELLKDLRGLGKPPSFDGNDAEYQDFRFSFRRHMSFVSSVSHELMDRCEIERNPISLSAVRALGEAHLKCCMQMYYKNPDRSVEETNGAEAWRLIHSRCAPDSQNRQYALMQKIMMPAKPWCDHTEGFQSGLRSWELDVGEWERASGTALADAVKYTVMMNMVPIFLRNVLQFVGTYANSTTLRAALLQWCHSSRNFGANPTVSAENGTGADDDNRMQVDSLKKGKRKGKGKNQHQRGNRTTSTTNTSSTDINTCKNCGKPGHWAKVCWNPGGGAYDNSTFRNIGKGNSKNTGKGKGTWTLSKQNNLSFLKQPQPCRILRKIRVLLHAWTRGSWV